MAIPPVDSAPGNPPGLRRVSAQSQDEYKFDCEREH
jgi:hypothetical protein